MATVTHAGPSLVTTSIVPALLPVPFHFAATGFLIAALGGVEEFARALMEAGSIIYLALLAAFVVAIINTVLFVRASRGTHINPFIPLALSVLPWVLGLIGTYLGSQLTMQAVENVNPADKATIMAAGIAESLNNRMIGAWFAGAQLAATGIALGALAMGRAGTNKNTAAAPIAAAALFAIAAPWMGMRLMGMNWTLAMMMPCLALGLALFFAGLGATGESEPNVSLVASATFAAVAGVAAVVASSVAGATTNVFSAVANVNPADKLTILQAGEGEIMQARLFFMLSVLIGFGAAGALSGVAFKRAAAHNPSPMSLAIPAIIAIGIVALDAAVTLIIPNSSTLLTVWNG